MWFIYADDTLLSIFFYLYFVNKGSRGVSVHLFSGLNSDNVDDLYNIHNFPGNPDKVALFPSFSPGGNYE